MLFSPLYKNLVILTLFLINILYGPSTQATPSPDMTLMAPMHDGTQLPTDLYLPKDKTGKFPCILLRSPSGRISPFATQFIPLTERGYVVAIQDTRSALDKEGKTFPYLSDGWGEKKDGYDTVEWLAQCDFSDGNIGTIGVSAMGITQLMLAPTAPPSLKCQYIGVAPASLYHYAVYPGGQVLKHQVESWLSYYANDSGVHSCLCGQPFYNDFWAKFNTIPVAENVKIPAVIQSGWFDTFLQGTIDAFLSRQEQGGEGARGKQKLLIGPWIHFWPVNTKLGDFEVPKEGYTPPIDISFLRWFDYYLKHIPNEADTIPAVTYYVMGPFDGSPSSGNVWKSADKWPIPCVETPFFLTSNNSLTNAQTASKEKTFSYRYDPFDPNQTIGGRNLFLESGPKDQRPIEQREDVIVFTSEPLEEDIEVTGRIKTLIHFSSDKEDTDIVVRLCDVYPDGRSILISDGINRIAMNSLYKEKTLPIEYEIDLWSTSIVFAKGHRIRISITSSNYPRYERNMNIGLMGSYSGASAIAHNTLYVGSTHPSRIILPVVRVGSK